MTALHRGRLLRRAIALSLLSVVLGAAMGMTGVVAALTSASLSLLGFGFDAAVDSAASVALVWRFAIEARQPHLAERVEKVAEGLLGLVLLVVALYLAVLRPRLTRLTVARRAAMPAAFELTWADAIGALIVALVLAREGISSLRAVRTHLPIWRRD